jgi:hypothetical protein
MAKNNEKAQRDRLKELEAEYLGSKELGETDFSSIFAKQTSEIKDLQEKLTNLPINEIQQAPVVEQPSDNKGWLVLLGCLAILLFGRNTKLFGFKLR